MDTRGIAGYARSVSELLSGKRYGLEFYQREYAWGRAQVEELVTDLLARFEDEYDEDHDRPAVANYRQYFLGPIITSDKDGTSFLIDGQQRTTTLSLLLIVLMGRLQDEEQRSDVRQLIYTSSYGRRSLTVDVPEREAVIKALVDGDEPHLAGASESEINLVERHRDLDELLELPEAELPLFTDWLMNKVVLVEIVAPEGDMAYDIFETMNDRGLRLSPTDMLKGYLLASIGDDKRIKAADDFWRKRVQTLSDARADADADFFKAWLRGHHAVTIRDRKRGAAAEDWDLIGTQFHKWVRDKSEQIGLLKPGDYEDFVTRSFDRMSQRYLTLLDATERLTTGLENVRFAAVAGVPSSLLTTLTLAPVSPGDDDAVARKKMNLVAGYLDMFVVHRILNYRNYGYSPTYYGLFQFAKRIRMLDVEDLRAVLRIEAEDLEPFESRGRFALHQRNGPQTKYVLARLTDELQSAVMGERPFDALLSRERKDPYEIEHIWANHVERHVGEFEHEQAFQSHRNRLGDLLLVPKSFNASYSDATYEAKLPHYRAQNVLAATLHPDTYQHNPKLRRYLEAEGVGLEPATTWSAERIDARQDAYLRIAGRIWDPKRVLQID